MDAVDLDDVRLHAECHGAEGPWITLVHGGLVGAASWRMQLPAKTKPNLLRAGRLLAYDQRGYGASSSAGRHDVATLANDLVGLWRALGVERTVVVGFSAGGFVALEAAALEPGRVTGLVLEGCGVPTDAVRRSFAERADALCHGDARTEVIAHVRRAFSDEFVALQPENVDEYAALALRVEPHALADTFRSIAAWSPSAAVRRLGCPALVVSGEHDPGFGPGPGGELCWRLDAARHVVIPGSGHTAHYERAPAFNYLVTEFVDALDNEGLEH